MVDAKEKQIDEILERGIVNIIPGKDELKKALLSDKKLNIYLGIDPTATRIHIGHAVPLRKLQALADLGHNITFLIGDFTALIGDTSDKDKERPVLTTEEIKENFATYKKQAEKILDYDKVKVVFNSEWLKKLTFEDIIKLCQNFSVGDFVGRTLIRNRLDAGKRVGLHETLYPVMQGYDSYHLDTDIQLGAADQTFNMQAGRTLNKNLRDKESFVLVNDYLPGTDGAKMSKTMGNAIWLDEEAGEMYAQLMRVNDEVLETYFLLSTNMSIKEIEDLKDMIKDDPMKAKKLLAYTVTEEFHGKEKAKSAQEKFEKTFQDRSPEYDREVELKETILEIVSEVVGSNSKAKKLLMDNAVKINEDVVTNPKHKIEKGDKIKIGKKIFVKVSK